MVKTRTRGREAPTAHEVEAVPAPALAHEPDLLDEMLAFLLQLAPEFQKRLEEMDAARKLREQLAGSSTRYIAHRRDLTQRNSAIRRDHAAGAHFGLLERRYRLTKRQLLRIVHGEG